MRYKVDYSHEHVYAMTMNIYITKENESFLRSLKSSMSGHINALIEVNRKNAARVKEYPPSPRVKKVPSTSVGTPSIISVKQETEEDQKQRWAKNPDYAVSPHGRFIGPLCKVHGTPLDARGKCLQKGCKYA